VGRGDALGRVAVAATDGLQRQALVVDDVVRRGVSAG
jgi:hypothetical protein